MKLRWLLPAALAVLLLAGCAPDSVSPGGGSSPTSHPPDHVTPSQAATPTDEAAAPTDAPSPSETERTINPYDY